MRAFYSLCVAVLAVTPLLSQPKNNAARERGEATMMEIIFGNYDPQTRSSRWNKPTKEVFEMLGAKPATVLVHPGGIFPFVKAGQRYALMVVWSTPLQGYDCHACAPAVSTILFKRNGTKWQVGGGAEALTSSGGWGRPGEFSLEKIGPEEFALVIKDGYTGQGETTSMATFYHVADKKMAKLVQLELHGDNGGACGQPGPGSCYSFDKKYTFVPSAKPFFDLTVTSTGTKIGDKGKVVHERGTQVMVYKNGEYVRVGK